MISGCPVTFVEPDLTTRLPACTGFIAAALAAGWRLASDGFPNHQDVLEGVAHLQDFKGASRKKLRRVITFRFRTRLIVIEGEEMRVEQFLTRCQADAAFHRAAQMHPRYGHWANQLKAKLPSSPRHLSASEPEAHDRVVTVPMNARPDWAARFAKGYEDGF